MSPIIVPITRVPTPIQSVDIHTSIVMKALTPITKFRSGTNSCIFSIPFPTSIITGTANSPDATVMASSLTKSAGGSTAFQMSMGYIMLSARAAPERGRPTMYRKPRTITVTAVLTDERIAMISRSRCWLLLTKSRSGVAPASASASWNNSRSSRESSSIPSKTMTCGIDSKPGWVPCSKSAGM